MTKATAEVKDPTMQELIQLVMSNKATAEQKKSLSRLLDSSAEEEAKAEFQQKLDRIKVALEKEGLTIQQVYDGLKAPVQPIFIWVDGNNVKHEKYGNEKGKPASWIAEMKGKLTKEQALENALTDSGKSWVEKLYTK